MKTRNQALLQPKSISAASFCFLCLFAFLGSTCASHAQELYRASLSSAAQSVGGAAVSTPTGPLDALTGNPAELTSVARKTIETGALGVFGTGSFTNAANPHGNSGRLNPLLGVAPFGAFAFPLRSSRWFAGASITPDLSTAVTWHYRDSPGAAGADYGYQRYHSSLLNVRYAGGLGYAVSPRLSLGATFGVVYNANTLQSPFVFQSQPVVAGLKTLLNLHTSGTGFNGSFGLLYTPRPTLRFGAAYKTRTVTHTSGYATGDLSAQLAALGISGFQTSYRYRARIDNTLPDALSLGLSAPLPRHAALSLEGDFVHWSNAFRQLPVRLSSGTNADLNGLVGSSTLFDLVPLHWRSQGVLRAGVSFPLRESTSIAAGYVLSNNPVPQATLTPLTAAFTRQFLTTGLSYQHGHFSAAAAYEAGLPQSEQVHQSQLLSGEYSNSRTDLFLQSLSLTTTYRF